MVSFVRIGCIGPWRASADAGCASFATRYALLVRMQTVTRFSFADRRQHARDAVVAITLELLDRARTNLFGGAVHDAIDQFVGERRRHQFSPWQRQCRAELLHEV